MADDLEEWLGPWNGMGWRERQCSDGEGPRERDATVMEKDRTRRDGVGMGVFKRMNEENKRMEMEETRTTRQAAENMVSTTAIHGACQGASIGYRIPRQGFGAAHIIDRDVFWCVKIWSRMWDDVESPPQAAAFLLNTIRRMK